MVYKLHLKNAVTKKGTIITKTTMTLEEWTMTANLSHPEDVILNKGCLIH